ncbi:hypothetical protein BDV96DRAFT_505460 [Lophiotrema nucula]|uniref:AMP-dependent synthetase/ligase domain-containing protein n=1 Tax=Lophiotrema nucula TaxID=690887 RepID=A0A6A5YLN3_9PLEO|nr:hypothetical protein BDV96DRAFT_505460 [Lophiotrema nucula]
MPESQGSDSRLLIKIIDEKAKLIPTHTFMRYPCEDWEENGYQTMTWKDLAGAVNKVAYWLDEQLGNSTNNDTIAYLGPNDARYIIMLAGTIKSNRNLFIPDGRLTKEGATNLIQFTKCEAWFYAEEDDSLTRELGVFDSGLRMCGLPSLEWCLDSSTAKIYPYVKTFHDAKFDVVTIIHTSGTTGTPKPIHLTNGYYSAQLSYKELSRKHWPKGIVHDAWIGKSMLTSCPPQWLGGIKPLLLSPVFSDCSAIIPPADATSFGPSVFKKLMQMNMIDGIMCPPLTITQLYKDPESQALLKRLDYIIYVGASLDKSIGDDLSMHTKITSVIGSTETGPQVDLTYTDRKLWHTHAYVPENGNRMVPIERSHTVSDSSADLYELVLDRPKEGANLYQAAWWNPMWNGRNTIETNELYTPVKDSDGQTRWVFTARKDDLTKLSWLQKFHAHDIETQIKQHADVAEVLVGGEGRPAPFVIVEMNEGVLKDKGANRLLDELYNGVIAQSNEKDLDEIRIPKETVMIAKAEKPFKMSFKQTVKRKDVEKDYSQEIEEAYARLERSNGTK